MTSTATCTKCGSLKSCDQFPPNKSRPSGIGSWCRACAGAASKAWALKKASCPEHRAKTARKSARTNRRLKYGISDADMDRMREEQDNRCGSCGDPLGPGRGTNVDHCHTTNRVRGLLCMPCNVALGHLRDDPERITGLLDYLTGASA